MPELPEVETVRRGLAPVLGGARIDSVEQRRANLRFPFPDNFAARLKGTSVVALNRRAKYLLATLDSGEVLVIHLGMSGRLTIDAADQSAAISQGQPGNPKHDHIKFRLASGATITYNDPRRFGFMDLISDTQLDDHPLFKNLGPEPLGNGFTADYLAARAMGRNSELKAFLLDQRIIAGLGNIYVCEALYRARLSPSRKTATLATVRARPTKRAHALVPAIKDVLIEAIEAGGSSLRDYRQADGAMGYFQHAFQVYGRDGEICRAKGCHATIRRMTQQARSTFYCPRCQRCQR